MGATPLKTVTNSFPLAGENQTSEAPGAVFNSTIGEEGVETPLPNDSSKASLSSPVGGCLRSFRRDWQTNTCSSKRVKHYHQWLRTAIPLKAKLGQISSDSVRIQDPSKRPSSSRLYPVSSVKERYRKGGKCKISWVLQSPVSSPQASPKVEASNRLKQAQHFSTCRKDQNGNSRVHQDLPGSRGMGNVDRPIGRLTSHPHPPKLKEIPKVLPQVTGVPVHLPSLWTSHSPPGLYNDRKGSEAHGPLQRTPTSPIPGPLADQVPVSGRTSEHSGSGRPNPVLGGG